MVRSSILFIATVAVVVCLVNCEGKLHRDIETKIVKQKIATLKYFLVVFCDDAEDDDCMELMDGVGGLFDTDHPSFPDLEAALVTDEALFEKYGVEFYPALIMFRSSEPIFYVDTQIETENIAVWMEQNRQSRVTELNDANFEHDTQATTGSTTGDWLIMFYEFRCSHSLNKLESVANWMHGQKVVGKINLSLNPGTKQRFNFKNCITVALFRSGKMYVYNDDLTKSDKIASFAREGFANVDALEIPAEPSLNIVGLAMSLWQTTIGKICVAGFGTLTIILLVLAILNKKRKRRAKFD